jgi:hypothetical protein
MADLSVLFVPQLYYLYLYLQSLQWCVSYESNIAGVSPVLHVSLHMVYVFLISSTFHRYMNIKNMKIHWVVEFLSVLDH